MKDPITANLLRFMVASNPNYLPTKMHKYLCNLVQKHIERGGARLAISVPPRHGKSEIVSKGLPAWYLGHNPTHEIMEIAHSADLATEFGGDVRATMSTPLYGLLFPDSVPSGDGKSGSKWRTISGGKYKGEGVDGSFTGFGANLLIVDDIVKNRKTAHSPTYQKNIRDTFGSAIFTRLLPDSHMIILNTRWSSADLIGYAVNELQGWTYINLPAIALEDDPLGRRPGEALCPERYPLEALLEIKSTMSEYDWLALYQGIPPDEVKVQSWNLTPLGVLPKVGVWHDDQVLLFNYKACTFMGSAETLSELIDLLNGIGATKLPIYCSEAGVANHSYTREVMPNLHYHAHLEGFTPDIDYTFPPGKVTSRIVGAARYYATLPRSGSGYVNGRLEHGVIIGTR